MKMQMNNISNNNNKKLAFQALSGDENMFKTRVL